MQQNKAFRRKTDRRKVVEFHARTYILGKVNFIKKNYNRTYTLKM